MAKTDDLTVDDETFAAVREQLRAAWRRANPTLPDEQMPEAITASEHSATKLHDDPWYAPPKLPKADERVTYRLAGEGSDETCYRCRYYQFGACALVEGGIEAAYVCDLYTAPLMTAPAAMFAIHVDGERPTLCVYQSTTFAEPPEWAPFLPVPGIYTHPIYGTLDFSPATYDRVIANFKNGIYQEKLPVNVEHDTYSSAVGWITDMRLADDGRIEAKVEWNKRGKALIEDDRYLYVSAELGREWSPPDKPEAIYQDVAFGLTLTTHPYFKERVLPPLAASEAVLTRHAGSPGRELGMSEKDAQTTETPPAAEKPTAVQLTEAEIQAFRQFQEAGGPTAFTALQASVKTLGEENTSLKQAGLVKRFTDEVRGRSDENGTPWVGDVEGHVKHLVWLAETAGADAEQVTHYVQTNRAHAAQLKAAGLFATVGTGRTGDEALTALDKLNAKATELAGKKDVTFAVAFAEVIATDKELARQYAAERR